MCRENNLNPLRRTELVVVSVGDLTSNEFNFGQLPNIRQAEKIIRIEAFDASQVTATEQNKTVVSAAALKKSFLKLVELGGSNAEIHKFPLPSLQRQNGQKSYDLNCQPIDFEKSSVKVADTTGINANEVFLFEVEYIKKK